LEVPKIGGVLNGVTEVKVVLLVVVVRSVEVVMVEFERVPRLIPRISS
jgi:hypothetical protein